MNRNITLITNIPSPYRVPLWDEVKKLSDFQVICIANNEKNREWETTSREYISFLKSYHLFFQKRDWALHFSLPFSVFFKLVKENPDAVMITGYDSPQYWEALLYAKLFGKKKVMWNGSTLLSSRSSHKLVNMLKNYFIGSFDAFYTYGTEATKYIESFGISKDKIFTGTNTIDTTFYKQNTPNERHSKETLDFLYVGQLIERKGLTNTLKAFSKIKYNDWILTIVGSGPQEEELKALVLEYNLEGKVNFVGFKQKEEIIDYFAKADVFLMPSYLEVWGLVLNEALASGLFCLSSQYAGATFDLIKDGKNGFIVDPKDVNDLTAKIDKTFNMEFNKESIKESFTVSYEEEARKILEAVKVEVK